MKCVDGRILSDLDLTNPIKLQGLTEDWPVCKTGIRDFINKCPDVKFRLRQSSSLHEYGFAGPSKGQVSLAEYFQETFVDTTAVIFENDFLSTVPILGREYSVPKILRRVHGMPIFSAGRRDTGVGMHRHNESWLAQLLGRKAWFLLPADCPRPPYQPPWKYWRERPEGLVVSIVEPGEVLFIPRGWWHATWNLDDEILAVGWEADADVAEMTAPEPIFAILDGDLDRLRRSLEGKKEKEIAAEAASALPMFEAAARSGSLEILRYLCQRFGSPSPREAPSVAIAAARSGQLEILQALLAAEVEDPEILFLHRMWWLPPIFPMGTTALHEAASCGHADVVAWLVDHKADPFLRDGSGCLPLHLSAIHGHAEALDTLLKRSPPEGDEGDRYQHLDSTWPLHQAAFGGHVESVKVLLATGAKVNVRDALRQTTLHYASLRGHSAMLRCLLDAKGQVNARDTQGRSPLHTCVRGSENGAEVLVPLATAAPPERDQHLNAIVVLLENKADVNIVDDHGRSPLDYALVAGHTRVAEAIRSKKSDRTTQPSVFMSCVLAQLHVY